MIYTVYFLNRNVFIGLIVCINLSCLTHNAKHYKVAVKHLIVYDYVLDNSLYWNRLLQKF